MDLDLEKINELLASTPELMSFSGFFAQQELERISEVLASVFVRMGKQAGEGDYKRWSSKLKPELLKELENSQIYFGFKDLPLRFPIDSFLESCYKELDPA